MSLAEAIKKIRADAGLTSEKFGERLGVTKGYISQLETGKLDTISFEFAARICKAFNLPMDHFVPILAPDLTVPPPPHQPANEYRCHLVGTIAAGPDDVPTIYHEPEWLTFDKPLPKEAFALRVVGNSCERFGIISGDIVVVEKTETPREGMFCVLGSTGGDWTLKAYSKGKWWQFRPTDPEPVEFKLHGSTRVFGVVIDGKYGPRGYEASGPKQVKPKKKGK